MSMEGVVNVRVGADEAWKYNLANALIYIYIEKSPKIPTTELKSNLQKLNRSRDGAAKKYRDKRSRIFHLQGNQVNPPPIDHTQ